MVAVVLSTFETRRAVGASVGSECTKMDIVCVDSWKGLVLFELEKQHIPLAAFLLHCSNCNVLFICGLVHRDRYKVHRQTENCCATHARNTMFIADANFQHVTGSALE